MITDDQAAMLRATLVGDLDTSDAVEARFSAEDWEGYAFLTVAAFAAALDRRYDGRAPSHEDVIQLVSDARRRYPQMASVIDPSAAERIVQQGYDGRSIADLTKSQVLETETFLLVAMIAEERLSDGELDAFVHKARKTIDGQD